MRLMALGLLLGAAPLFAPAAALADETAPAAPAGSASASAAGGAAAGAGGAASMPAPPPAMPAVAPPPEPAAAAPPQSGSSTSSSVGAAEGASLTGAPDPTALGNGSGSDWRFSFHGFTRAPMRVGVGSRPQCPAGQMPGTSVSPSGGTMPMGGAAQVPCAGSNQSTVALHTPFVPDSQYLDWRYDRQQEYDWTELFFNYGNNLVTATVAVMAFGFSDAEYIAYTNASTQLGIAQGYLTIHPDLGRHDLRLQAKIGSFWDKYGMAGEYDAGKYDTYMFGRTHQVGETISLEYDWNDLTFRLSHGLGTHSEQLAFTPLQAGLYTIPAGNESNYPGFTLLQHGHLGVSYKDMVAVDAHYLTSWAQDYRAVGFQNGQLTDGHIDIYGAEAKVKPGGGARVYLGYSHIQAENPQVVGPAVEAVHSLGGGNYEAGNGVIDNFLGCTVPGASPGTTSMNPAGGFCETTQNSIGAPHGSVDNIELEYDQSFGALYRKLKTGEGFWGDGWDVNLSIFGMYSAVSSSLKTADTGSILQGDGVKKLKYGADLVVAPLKWLGFGVRGDFVQPTNVNASQNFTVISPKILFHTNWVTHEEITLWYSHYSYGSGVLPQAPNGTVNPNAGAPSGPFPADENVIGLKGTFWW
jgi:hypothetical protein